jgi:PIN domain nuclease of toxin-antitoxin system
LNVLLDTHFWVWWLTPASPLSVAERGALDQLAEQRKLAISAISLWEVQMLHAKGRLELPVSVAEWLGQAAAEDLVALLPFDVDVVLALDALPAAFHGDPADRVIVATARSLGMPLATRDAAIRKSRLVKIWKP